MGLRSVVLGRVVLLVVAHDLRVEWDVVVVLERVHVCYWDGGVRDIR